MLENLLSILSSLLCQAISNLLLFLLLLMLCPIHNNAWALATQLLNSTNPFSWINLFYRSCFACRSCVIDPARLTFDCFNYCVPFSGLRTTLNAVNSSRSKTCTWLWGDFEKRKANSKKFVILVQWLTGGDSLMDTWTVARTH